MRVIVAKVGGSLFDLPDLRQRLDAWLATIDDACVLLVPGGGAGADVIRQLDHTHRLGEEASHWLALRVLTVNAHFLSRLLAVPVICSIARPIPRRAVLDAHDLCREDEGKPGSLPHRWEVTSDSIAARVATIVSAELVLLKSVDLPPNSNWDEAAKRGLVDASFPKQIAAANVTWINLRQPSFAASR